MDVRGGFPASAPEPICPQPVVRAAMTNRWRWLTYLHWPYDPAVVQALLPEGLRVDTHDRKAWVGLIPFRMEVALPGLPPVPYLSTFPETNVRTYVVGPDGKPGVWFFSLDASRLPAVLVARGWFGLAYRWATMRIEREGRRVRYTSVRREGPSASSSVEVEVGEPVPAREMTDLDHFLVSRWRLYSAGRRGLVLGRIDHAPWALRSAELVGVRQDLVEAAGLPSPDGEPIVRYAPGVGVRIAPPARLGNRER
jgi:uncharacterized protein YqjF (DUF2071 family)